MAGNSQRRGAMRKPGSKKGATVGSGGQRRKGLQGRGPTPKAKDRQHHPAARKARRAEKHVTPRTRRSSGSTLMGRNAVLEALRAGIPATSLHVQVRASADERWREVMRLALHRNIPLMEVSKSELDRIADGGVHQGLVLSVPGFHYADPDAILSGQLVLALDGITDPRNLGAIARSAAAFGASGILIPERRSVGVTASSWKASAGALSRMPVAQITNLTRTLVGAQKSGFTVIGLDAKAEHRIDDIPQDILSDRVLLVIGSEGSGLSRLVAETCDWLVSIPMSTDTESLNAAVAASIALYAMRQTQT